MFNLCVCVLDYFDFIEVKFEEFKNVKLEDEDEEDEEELEVVVLDFFVNFVVIGGRFVFFSFKKKLFFSLGFGFL